MKQNTYNVTRETTEALLLEVVSEVSLTENHNEPAIEFNDWLCTSTLSAALIDTWV